MRSSVRVGPIPKSPGRIASGPALRHGTAGGGGRRVRTSPGWSPLRAGCAAGRPLRRAGHGRRPGNPERRGEPARRRVGVPGGGVARSSSGRFQGRPWRTASAPSCRSAITGFPNCRGLGLVGGGIQDGSDGVITSAMPVIIASTRRAPPAGPRRGSPEAMTGDEIRRQRGGGASFRAAWPVPLGDVSHRRLRPIRGRACVWVAPTGLGRAWCVLPADDERAGRRR